MKAFYRLFYYISILLSCILAGVTIAGAFSGTASPDSFKFMPFIGLGLPILLLVNLASAVYWTIRWRCWVFIPLIAIFSNWGYINCVLQFPLLDPASKPTVKVNAYTPGVLTVATYNVDGFNRVHTGYSCKEMSLASTVYVLRCLTGLIIIFLLLPKDNIFYNLLFSAVILSKRSI